MSRDPSTTGSKPALREDVTLDVVDQEERQRFTVRLAEQLNEAYSRWPLGTNSAAAAVEILLVVAGSILLASPLVGVPILVFAAVLRVLDHKARHQLQLARDESERRREVAETRESDVLDIAADLVVSSRHTLNGYLRSLLQEAGIKLDNTRVTLFIPSEDEKRLEIAARWAQTAAWRKFRLRDYPSDKGFIGRAWNNGYAESGRLPDPETDPEGYRNAHAESGYEAEFERISMRSRSYYCFRLGRLIGNERGGVLAVESTAAQISKIGSLKEALAPRSPQLLVLEGMLPTAEALKKLDERGSPQAPADGDD